MKKLKDILNGISYSILSGSDDIEINDIKYDSRKVKKNDVYIALKGYTTDGHEYIPEAIAKGAKVIIVSKILNIVGDVTIIKVDDSRKINIKPYEEARDEILEKIMDEKFHEFMEKTVSNPRIELYIKVGKEKNIENDELSNNNAKGQEENKEQDLDYEEMEK